MCSNSYKNNIFENFIFLILRMIELFTRKICEMFLYKLTETIEYVSKSQKLLKFTEKYFYPTLSSFWVNLS